jgi:hypothetical protein
MTPEERKARSLVRRMLRLLEDASYEVKDFTDGRNDKWFDRFNAISAEAEVFLEKR